MNARTIRRIAPSPAMTGGPGSHLATHATGADALALGAPAPDAAARTIRSRRRAIGTAIVIGGALLLSGQIVEAARLALASSETLRLGVLFSLLAGLATGLGALPLLFPGIASIRWTRRALGLADGRDSDFDAGSPGPVNDALTRIFASERHLLGRVRLPVGVSLIAVSRIPR